MKKWTDRSKKQKILIIIAAITVVFFTAGIVVACIFLIEPSYPVDLSKIIADENIVWSDEFDGDALDETVWHIENNYDVGGAYHRKKAVELKDGELNLNLYYNEEDKEWQAGGIDTMPRGEDAPGMMQKYGYFEIRARLADMGGAWCTFWLLSQNYQKATSTSAAEWGAEIDILEAPMYPQNKIQQAVHIGGWESKHMSFANPRYGAQDIGNNIYQEYNTYGVYWNEDIYKFYVNRKCVWTTHQFHNVSKVPQGIYITIGTVGGYNEGLKGWANGNLLEDNPRTKRATYAVDYVRIYGAYDKDGKVMR